MNRHDHDPPPRGSGPTAGDRAGETVSRRHSSGPLVDLRARPEHHTGVGVLSRDDEQSGPQREMASMSQGIAGRSASAVPGPRVHDASSRHHFLDAVGQLATERIPTGYLCAGSTFLEQLETQVLQRPDPRATPAPSPRKFAWLLLAAGLLGLLVTVLRAGERSGATDVVPACGADAGFLCETVANGPSGLLNSLIGIAGFAVVAAVGAMMAAGAALPRRAGVGLLVVVTVGVLFTHGLVIRSLYVLETLCYSCVAACLLAIPMFWYTAVHAQAQGWVRVPEVLRATTAGATAHRRTIVIGWCLAVIAVAFLGSDAYRQNPAEEGALGAVALISAATVIGALVASRFSSRMGLWLSVASAMMLVTALTDIIPDVLHDAEEVGTPLWMPAVALVIGFVVVTYFTRQGCGHGHGDDDQHEDASATGRHREAKADSRSAGFGGVGAAAALTLHRAIEGATLALTPSLPVIGALFIHSASEGLALAALFQQTRRSMLPWLMISVAGPVVGVILASVSPLPEAAVPVLLALVGGVLLRTAMVGLGLVVAKRRTGELRIWHIAVSVAAAAALAALTLAAH